MEDRAAVTGEDAVVAPDFVGVCNVALAGGVDADDAAEGGVVEVFLAVGCVHLVASDDDRGVDAAPTELEAPHGLASADFHGIDGAVGVAADEQADAVDGGDDGHGIRGVEGSAPRSGDPDEFAAALVKGEVAVAARRVAAPIGTEIADDDEVFIDDGRVDAAAVAGDAPKFLGQRARPYYLAVAVKAKEQPADGVGIDVAGLWVAGEAGPADAVEGDGGVEDVVGVFPEQGAVLGVKSGDNTFVLDVLAATTNDEYSSVEDDGSRAASKLGVPDRRPRCDEAGFLGDAVLRGAAPGGPVGWIGAGSGE